MSHMTRCKTKLSDQGCLIKALADVGYKKIEVHEKASNLYGYQGDMREQTAEIVIRRAQIGSSSNDMGFKRAEDGTFEAIISDYDKNRHGVQWLKKLNQRYAYHKVTQELGEMGYEVGEVTTEGGKLKFQAVSAYGG